jgi:ribosomal protein L16 Arg81 hydroxylase
VWVELLAVAPGDLRAAQSAYDRGRRKLEERRVAPRNLYDAWKQFLAARRAMEELSPRPPLYDEVAQLIKDAERELDKQCQRLLFTASRADHYGQKEKAQQTYKEVLLHFPGEDPSGCRRKAQENIVTAPVGGP